MAVLLILFIVVPILELYVIIEVGGLIGILPTLALLVATAVLGSLLLRQQGRDAWRRFNANISARRFPGREVVDGLMIAIGGALLLAPGFLTDIVGLLLLVPPTRALLRRLLRVYFAKRFLLVDIGSQAASRKANRPYDFDASGEEIDPDDPRLPR